MTEASLLDTNSVPINYGSRLSRREGPRQLSLWDSLFETMIFLLFSFYIMVDKKGGII